MNYSLCSRAGKLVELPPSDLTISHFTGSFHGSVKIVFVLDRL